MASATSAASRTVPFATVLPTVPQSQPSWQAQSESAVVAIASWLLARLIREWWGSSADEHEQRVSDFGRRVGAGAFLAVTPAWWVAWRAGLAPQPDVMVVWLLTWMVTSAAWSWRRFN